MKAFNMLIKFIRKTKAKFQPVIWALYKFYMSRPRWYKFREISVLVLPSVFHPFFFISTKVLLEYLLKYELRHKKVLELGAGSGLISLVAAKIGAQVTSTDLNPEAIEGLKISYEKNDLSGVIIWSDLFDQIPPQDFDIILINPPYFPHPARDNLEMAFYCGSNFEYYRKLFQQLPCFLTLNSIALMILNEACEQKTIREIAQENQVDLDLKLAVNKFGEKQFIYQLHKI